MSDVMRADQALKFADDLHVVIQLHCADLDDLERDLFFFINFVSGLIPFQVQTDIVHSLLFLFAARQNFGIFRAADFGKKPFQNRRADAASLLV